MTVELRRKFIEGLESYGLDVHDVQTNWKYCGGDQGRHWRYWKLMCPEKEQPNYKDRCVCSHATQENCYICYKDQTFFLVIGNFCIKRFMTHSGRTCELCNESHKNRTVNRWNDCKNRCKDCSERANKL